MGLLGAFSCAVFPDEATLPASSAGSASEAGKSSGGTSVLPSGGASSSEAGTAMQLGGASNQGGSLVVQGGAPIQDGGSTGDGGTPMGPGGAGGMPGCGEPQEREIFASADTWIEAAKPSDGHGNDQALSIVGGGQERRTLLEFPLPAVVPGALLLKATLSLHLQANADAGLAERRLQVRRLSQAVSEDRTNWTNWGNGGSRKWLTPGGDFGSVLDSARISAGTAQGPLIFDVTATVSEAWSSAAAALPFIVMENGAPPAPPAELAFTSRAGDASDVPVLLLQYCEP